MVHVDITYTWSDHAIKLVIPKSVLSEDELIILMEYILPIEKYMDSVTVLSRGLRWYPHIVDDIMMCRIEAIISSDYTLYSFGNIIKVNQYNNSTRYIWESQIPVFKLPLIIADSNYYHHKSIEVLDKTIHLYSFTITDDEQDKILTEAGNVFEYYEKQIGDYHHNDLTMIEIPDFKGTSIATSLIMFGSIYVNYYKNAIYDNIHFSLATQWLAAGVFFKLFDKGFWFFQMSLPHHVRLMYVQATQGDSAFTEALNKGMKDYLEIKGTEDEVSILDVDFLSSQAKGSAVYGKGPYVIEITRKQIGSENWKMFIKEFYREFKGKIATYNDFVECLLRYDPTGYSTVTLAKMLSEKGLPEE